MPSSANVLRVTVKSLQHFFVQEPAYSHADLKFNNASLSNDDPFTQGGEGRKDSARHLLHFKAHLDCLLHSCGPAGLPLFAVGHIVCLSCLTPLLSIKSRGSVRHDDGDG